MKHLWPERDVTVMIDPDQAIQEALNIPALSGYDRFFEAITWLGSAGLWLIVFALFIVAGRWRQIACVLFITVAFSTIVNEDIKGIVQRTRPGDVIVGGYYVYKSYSFPSGHAQVAFAIATALSAFLERRYNIITYLLATAVSLSRIYLGVHYFTDVVAGAVVGVLLSVAAIYGLYRLELYRGKGMFGVAPRPTEKNTGKRALDSDRIKYALVILAAGFSASLVAFALTQFILSLLILGIMYLLLLSLPSLSKGLLSQYH